MATPTMRLVVGAAVLLSVGTFALQIGDDDEWGHHGGFYSAAHLGKHNIVHGVRHGYPSTSEHVVHHAPQQVITNVYDSLNEGRPNMPQPESDAESTDVPAPKEPMEAPLDARASEELADEQPGFGRGYGVGGYGVGGYGYAGGYAGGVVRAGYGGVGPYGVGGFNRPAAHTVVHHPRPAQAVTHVYHSLNEEKHKMPPAAGADFDDAESTDAPAPMESREAPLDARASEEWGRGYGVAGPAYGGGGFVRGGRGYGGVGPYVNGVGPIAQGAFNGPAVAHTVVHHPPAHAVTHVYRNEDDDKEDEE